MAEAHVQISMKLEEVQLMSFWIHISLSVINVSQQILVILLKTVIETYLNYIRIYERNNLNEK